MAIQSMTGFARAQCKADERLNYTLSLKSVNHRFLDLQFRLPPGMDGLEMELRKTLKENLARGHVDVTLTVDRTAQAGIGYNRDLVGAFLTAFQAAKEEHQLNGEPDLNAALRLPGALQADSRGEAELEALAASAMQQIGALVGELKAMRSREGEALETILRDTLDRLAEATAGIAAQRPEIEERYRERLTQKLIAATGEEFNRQRLLEEVAVLVDRSDISEELTRMETHIVHFRELLDAEGEAGKKLDFLLQEMNREANTLLSKTGGVAGKGTRITELGLKMKAEIEKAREQVQNVE